MGEGSARRGRLLFFKKKVAAPLLDFSPDHVKLAGCWQADQARCETCQHAQTTHTHSQLLSSTRDNLQSKLGSPAHCCSPQSPVLPLGSSLHRAPYRRTQHDRMLKAAHSLDLSKEQTSWKHIYKSYCTRIPMAAHFSSPCATQVTLEM